MPQEMVSTKLAMFYLCIPDI